MSNGSAVGGLTSCRILDNTELSVALIQLAVDGTAFRCSLSCIRPRSSISVYEMKRTAGTRAMHTVVLISDAQTWASTQVLS